MVPNTEKERGKIKTRVLFERPRSWVGEKDLEGLEVLQKGAVTSTKANMMAVRSSDRFKIPDDLREMAALAKVQRPGVEEGSQEEGKAGTEGIWCEGWSPLQGKNGEKATN